MFSNQLALNTLKVWDIVQQLRDADGELVQTY